MTTYLTQHVFDNISNSLNLRQLWLSEEDLNINVLPLRQPAPPWNANLAPNDPARDHWRQKTKEQFADPIKRNNHLQACLVKSNHKDKIWVNNGFENKRILEAQLVNFTGWVRGRLIPRDKINLMIQNRTNIRNPKTGKFMKKGEVT